MTTDIIKNKVAKAAITACRAAIISIVELKTKAEYNTAVDELKTATNASMKAEIALRKYDRQAWTADKTLTSDIASKASNSRYKAECAVEIKLAVKISTKAASTKANAAAKAAKAACIKVIDQSTLSIANTYYAKAYDAELTRMKIANTAAKKEIMRKFTANKIECQQTKDMCDMVNVVSDDTRDDVYELECQIKLKAYGIRDTMEFMIKDNYAFDEQFQEAFDIYYKSNGKQVPEFIKGHEKIFDKLVCVRNKFEIAERKCTDADSALTRAKNKTIDIRNEARHAQLLANAIKSLAKSNPTLTLSTVCF